VALKRLPIETTTKTGLRVRITEVVDSKEHASDLTVMCAMLNAEIEDGNSYPQEHTLTLDQFKAYFMSQNVRTTCTAPQHCVLHDPSLSLWC
jgi:hypothetical protein